ncbi:MAG: hypothetical protein WDA22_15525 [Bacteroidota bacterium]
MKKIVPYLIRLSITGLLFILLVYIYSSYTGMSYSNKYAALRGIIVVLSIGGLVLLYQIMQAILFVITSRPNPSPKLVRFYELGIGGILQRYYAQQLSPRNKTLLWFVVWGASIISFMLIMNVNQVFNGNEDFFLQNRSIERMYREAITRQFPNPKNYVEVLHFYSEDNNPHRYITDMIKISEDLKDAGAKVVIIELPGRLYPMTERRLKRLDSLVNVLQSMSRVTFAGDYWYYQNPISKNNLSPLTVKKIEPYTRYYSNLVRHFPYRYTADIALSVARRYYGIPDSIRPVKIGNTIIVGDIKVPVNSNGEAFSDNICIIRLLRNFHYVAFHGFNDNGSTDMVQYTADISSIGRDSQIDKVPITDLRKFKNDFEKKIVLIAWNYSDGLFTSPIYTQAVASSIISLIENSNYVQSRELTIALIILSVLIIGITVYRFGFFVSLILTAFLFTIYIAGGIWVFLSSRMIVEVLYPVAATILSFIVFSLLKLSFKTA